MFEGTKRKGFPVGPTRTLNVSASGAGSSTKRVAAASRSLSHNMALLRSGRLHGGRNSTKGVLLQAYP